MTDKLSKEPLVSVIIPTYNRAGIIRRTIESVMGQTYQNLDIIIVDDASQDNTEEVVKAIQDERIRYIRNVKNQGASITRNNGVEAARGEYVAFLDSDDVWLPNKIELQLPLFHNHLNREKVVGYTQVTNDEGVSVSVMPDRAKKEAESLADYLFVNGGFMQTGTLIMPTKLALETPFRSGIVPHEDPDLCLRLEAKGVDFVFLEQPLTVWNNDKRGNRATGMSDYLVSLNWIKEYEGIISPKAYRGVLVTEVVRRLIDSEQKRIYAEKLLLEALFYGAISPPQFLLSTRRVMIPKTIRKPLKDLWDKVVSGKQQSRIEKER